MITNTGNRNTPEVSAYFRAMQLHPRLPNVLSLLIYMVLAHNFCDKVALKSQRYLPELDFCRTFATTFERYAGGGRHGGCEIRRADTKVDNWG